MPMNRIQCQAGLSLLAFHEPFGGEAQCEAELERVRWPDGFRCSQCGHRPAHALRVDARKTFQ